MNQSTRNQTVRFSCSLEENKQIQKKIIDSGQNKNDYMISVVLNESIWDCKNKIKNAAITVCEISDEVNHLQSNYLEVDFTSLRKEVNKLCQQLL